MQLVYVYTYICKNGEVGDTFNIIYIGIDRCFGELGLLKRRYSESLDCT